MTIAWKDDLRQIITWTLSGELDWEELHRMMSTAADMLDSADGPVYVLAVVDNFRLPAETPLHFPAVVQNRYWRHPRLRGTIAVGADHFFRMMIDIFSRVYESIGERIFVVQTLDEAHRIILEDSRG